MIADNLVFKLDSVGICYEDPEHIRDSVGSLFLRPFRKQTKFWALKNVTFEIPKGEIIFIIGRNGAGKSTLLKVLSGTLFPDVGTFYFNSSLSRTFISMKLGFKQDLSGLENAKLMLRLLGVNKVNLHQIIESVVTFSGLEKFFKSPVKNYSAGMRSRLAFAIATSINPDILIMDEVVQTGDELFKEKCKMRLRDLLSTIKGVVACGHNLDTVLELATQVVWVEQGGIVDIGSPEKIVSAYRHFMSKMQ